MRVTPAKAALVAAHVTAMVATPLARRGRRAGLATAVVATLAGMTHVAVARRWGPPRAAVAAAGVGALAASVEGAGIRTGWPFGRYDYTGVLRPTIAGVPVVVPAAWFAMAVPAREVAHGALGRRSTARRRVVLGAACLTAWDLFLDPQMVAEGYWRWRRGGRYRGVPWSNFAGWAATGAAVMAALEVVLPPAEPDAALVGEFAWMGVMQTIGFAWFFDREDVTGRAARPSNAVVAALGGAAMLVPAAAALQQLAGARRPAKAAGSSRGA